MGQENPYHEFAHAGVLPYDEPHVILWAQDQCNGVGFTDTYLWKANDPGRIGVISGSPSSQYTMFCSGHTWLADGRLFVAGGTDYATGCPLGNPNTGHNRAFLFDPFAQPNPTWAAASGGMSKLRWYPTVVPLGEQNPLIVGHTGQPMDAIPQKEFHERFDPTTGTFPVVDETRTFDTVNVPNGCDPERLPIVDYPRMHQLRSELVMWSDGLYRTTGATNPLCGGGSGGAFPLVGFFDYTTNFGCANPPERWLLRCAPEAIDRDQTNSVHLLWPDPVPTEPYHEVVYLIGGLDVVADFPTNRVDKMVDPDPSKVWDTTAPDMVHARYNSNCVIGLDGSLIAVGGQGVDAGNLVPVKHAERLQPPEIFPSSTNVWKQMAPQAYNREYHSVAGLLPDGRIFSAGGEDEYLGAEGDPEHTISIYSPTYLYQGPRPEITSVLATWDYTQQQNISITLPQGKTVSRVALIRNGSITHAFDASQRYVVLRVVNQSATQVTVIPPPDAFHAPAGYYMVTVVDSDGVPSAGTFIKLG